MWILWNSTYTGVKRTRKLTFGPGFQRHLDNSTTSGDIGPCPQDVRMVEHFWCWFPCSYFGEIPQSAVAVSLATPNRASGGRPSFMLARPLLSSPALFGSGGLCSRAVTQVPARLHLIAIASILRGGGGTPAAAAAAAATGLRMSRWRDPIPIVAILCPPHLQLL